MYGLHMGWYVIIISHDKLESCFGYPGQFSKTNLQDLFYIWQSQNGEIVIQYIRCALASCIKIVYFLDKHRK